MTNAQDVTGLGAKPLAPPKTYAYFTLFLLYLIYTMNFADRQILSILANAVKADMHLHDWEVGMLTGPALALFYAVLGLPIAFMADRVHRVRFLAVCLVVWSGLTALGGFARNVVQLGATRLGVSIAEAGGTPISASLIADYFPPSRRGGAFGIYASSTATGVLVGFALGGVVNEWFGWRGAMIAAGIPGLVLTVALLLTVREPKRGAADPDGGASTKKQTISLWATAKHLWGTVQYRRMVLSCAFLNFTVYVLLAWSPAVALRTFSNIGTGSVGIIMGAGFALVGVIGQIGVGFLFDYFNKRDRALPVRVVAFTQILPIPCLLVALTTTNFAVFMAALSFAYGIACSYGAAGFSVTQNYTPPEMRASAAAHMTMVYSIVGLGLGPPIVGLLSDLLASTYGAASLKYALLAIVFSSGLSAALLAFWAAPSLDNKKAAASSQ